MTNKQRRYYSRKTQQHRVEQLVQQVSQHPNHRELLSLLQDQVLDDTRFVRPQIVFT